jgi:hypothetical protein
MSLTVYLHSKEPFERPQRSGIFIRENGVQKEISREEWDRRRPGEEPVRVVYPDENTTELYSRNITHNLLKMAMAARIGECIWFPEEAGISTAGELIAPLTKGLQQLVAEPEKYRKFNPENGWGTYEVFVEFVEDYLGACKEYPDAGIEASR